MQFCKMLIAQAIALPSLRERKGKAKLCYTGFALSDLAVSSGLPLTTASLPGTDFPQAPTAYTYESPTRRFRVGLQKRSTARVRAICFLLRLLEWTGALDKLDWLE
jgi:hypothetical protein